MKKLPADIIKMIEEYQALGARIRDAISEHTSDSYHMCYVPYVQLWADPTSPDANVKALEELVGNKPVPAHVSEEGAIHYYFDIGHTKGVIIMSDFGGTSDDVRTYEEA